MSMKSNTYICQIRLIAFFLFAITTMPAFAQNQLNVSGNSVTVSSGGLGATPLAIDANGIVATPTLPFAGVTGGAALPNFTYTMQSTGVTDGTYTFRAGFIIDDNASNRRLEISIPSLTMTFSSSGTALAGSVPAGSSVTVLGRAADNTTQLSATVANALFSFSGSNVSFNAGAQVTEIASKPGILGDIATTLGSAGVYTYAVVLRQTDGPAALKFGRSGPFTEFGCAPSNLFVLNSGQFGSDYSGGWGLQGQFILSTGTAGGAPTTLGLREVVWVVLHRFTVPAACT